MRGRRTTRRPGRSVVAPRDAFCAVNPNEAAFHTAPCGDCRSLVRTDSLRSAIHLSNPAREALAATLLSLSPTTKRILGMRYGESISSAPSTFESGIACSAMAQDEWGHGRILCARSSRTRLQRRHAAARSRPSEEYLSWDCWTGRSRKSGYLALNLPVQPGADPAEGADEQQLPADIARRPASCSRRRDST